MLDTVLEFLDGYQIFMEDPITIYVLIDLLPNHLQYVFVKKLIELKDHFYNPPPFSNEKKHGLIKVEGDRIIYKDNPDTTETITLLELPAPWLIE